MVRVTLFRRVPTIVAALLVAGSVAMTPRLTAAQEAAAGFIANLGNEAMRVIGPSVPPAQREAQFRRIFSSDFDLDGAARFVMGPYWRGLSPEQQQQFLILFRDTMAKSYASRLEQYAGAPFRVTGSRPNGDETIVASQVLRAGKPIEMDWHVVHRGGRFLISDVYVDGVSMKVTERQEFAGIIQRNGGRPEALLAVLRQELGQATTGFGSSAPAEATPYQAGAASRSWSGPANRYEASPAYGR